MAMNYKGGAMGGAMQRPDPYKPKRSSPNNLGMSYGKQQPTRRPMGGGLGSPTMGGVMTPPIMAGKSKPYPSSTPGVDMPIGGFPVGKPTLPTERPGSGPGDGRIGGPLPPIQTDPGPGRGIGGPLPPIQVDPGPGRGIGGPMPPVQVGPVGGTPPGRGVGGPLPPIQVGGPIPELDGPFPPVGGPITGGPSTTPRGQFGETPPDMPIGGLGGPVGPPGRGPYGGYDTLGDWEHSWFRK
jgi:hypothetical protein